MKSVKLIIDAINVKLSQSIVENVNNDIVIKVQKLESITVTLVEVKKRVISGIYFTFNKVATTSWVEYSSRIL